MMTVTSATIGDRTITNTAYKGYDIVHNFYGNGWYTVQYCGDDITFETFDEAVAFVDEMDADPENRREY